MSISSHGCKKSSARIRTFFSTASLLLALVIVLAQGQISHAELLVYLKSGSTELIVKDGDLNYDLDGEVNNFINLDTTQLASTFSGWSFGSFVQVQSTLGDNALTGLPARRLNIEFDAQNISGQDGDFELVAMFIGSGDNKPSIIQLFGAGTSESNFSGGVFDIAGSFVQSPDLTYNPDNDSNPYTPPNSWFYTNGYSPASGPSNFVLVENPVISDNKYNSSNPTLSIDGSSSYAINLGFRFAGLADQNSFTYKYNLDYVLPEPASMATWAVVAGLVGFAGNRKRKARLR